MNLTRSLSENSPNLKCCVLRATRLSFFYSHFFPPILNFNDSKVSKSALETFCEERQSFNNTKLGRYKGAKIPELFSFNRAILFFLRKKTLLYCEWSALSSANLIWLLKLRYFTSSPLSSVTWFDRDWRLFSRSLLSSLHSWLSSKRPRCFYLTPRKIRGNGERGGKKNLV